ncbi:MAG: hypothetical protein Q6365_016425 [Candidatus Sigynarchaeota archaeon]
METSELVSASMVFGHLVQESTLISIFLKGRESPLCITRADTFQGVMVIGGTMFARFFIACLKEIIHVNIGEIYRIDTVPVQEPRPRYSSGAELRGVLADTYEENERSLSSGERAVLAMLQATGLDDELKFAMYRAIASFADQVIDKVRCVPRPARARSSGKGPLPEDAVSRE